MGWTSGACLLWIVLMGLPFSSTFAASVLTLNDLLLLGLGHNPAVLAAREQVSASEGLAAAARAYPNPEISGLTGRGKEQNVPAPLSGSVYSFALHQPLEYPGLRNPRIQAAEASVQAADAARRAFENDALAAIKLAYYDLLRRQDEAQASEEDLQITQKIRDSIALRYHVGESPRFDLITAETERLNALKNHDMALLRTRQARIALRQAVGQSIPEETQIVGTLPDAVVMPPLATLQEQLNARNPELQQVQAENQAAESRVDWQKAQRLPQWALVAQHDADPTLSSSRVGVAVTIPLWDQHSGPVLQAQAELARSRHVVDSRRQWLGESLSAAYERFDSARNQVSLLENELLVQATEAKNVAEAAYRHGERGILDWLNAQRTYRIARSELITARYDLATVIVEIDRLLAIPPSVLSSNAPTP